MTGEEFNLKYPKRLKLLAERAQTQVVDGVQQPYSARKGRDLWLTAYWSQTDQRGFDYTCDRVIIQPNQTKASLTRILCSMFVLDEAERVYAVWQGQLYADTRVSRFVNHQLVDVKRPHLLGMDSVA